MRENYAGILKRVLVHEGGYSDHPADNGGATMTGVTQAVYDGYRSEHGLLHRSVRQLEDAELQAIYRLRYWDRIAGDRLPAGVDYVVFDGAVNSGYVQPLKVDGVVGFGTLGGLRKVNDLAGLIEVMHKQRMTFLRRLKDWKAFGGGWTTRVADVRRVSLAMAGPTVAGTATRAA